MENAQKLYSLLMVDDDKKLVSMTLPILGEDLSLSPLLRIRSSPDLTDAEQKIYEEKPDILLLDTNFKKKGEEITSFNFYSDLREKYSSRVYVISMSYWPDHEKKWKELEVDCFLEKPLDMDLLEKEIEKAIAYFKSKTLSET